MPMPGARANGMLAPIPIRKQAMREDAAVAEMRERLTSSCDKGQERLESAQPFAVKIYAPE